MGVVRKGCRRRRRFRVANLGHRLCRHSLSYFHVWEWEGMWENFRLEVWLATWGRWKKVFGVLLLGYKRSAGSIAVMHILWLSQVLAEKKRTEHSLCHSCYCSRDKSTIHVIYNDKINSLSLSLILDKNNILVYTTLGPLFIKKNTNDTRMYGIDTADSADKMRLRLVHMNLLFSTKYNVYIT